MPAGRKKQNRRPPTKRPPVPRPGAKPKTTPSAGAPQAGAPTTPPAPASTPPRKTQAQRLDEARKSRARKSRNTRLAVAGGVLLLVGLLAFNTLGNRQDTKALRTRLTAGDCTFDTRADPTSSGTANHTPPAGYVVDPPAGGNHDPGAAGAGTYTDATRPTDMQVVHSLEHGYIAVWHQPGMDEAALAALSKAVEGSERDVLILPRATLTGQVAATAWGERLLCPTLEAGPLQAFIDAYANKGPERVPHPAL